MFFLYYLNTIEDSNLAAYASFCRLNNIIIKFSQSLMDEYTLDYLVPVYGSSCTTNTKNCCFSIF